MGAENNNRPNDFSDTPPADIASFTIDNNLYWNGDAPIPEDGNELINYTDDTNRQVTNPLLPDITNVVVPRWNSGTGQFADGSDTIRAAFERLVNLYGKPSQGSPVVDKADATASPTEDILGRSRGGMPDIGAVEFQSALSLAGQGGDEAIFLNWTVNTSLPPDSAWRLIYGTSNIDQQVVTGILSPTRAFTLTSLINYEPYTVTLNAMLTNSPFLTGTITVTPSDRNLYLPILLK